jgi:hypothetical protein
MGQKSGLEDSYLKLSEEELLEGDSKHVGYIGIIDQLTINEENRLKLKNRELEIRMKEDEDRIKRIFEEREKSLNDVKQKVAFLEERLGIK